MSSEEADYQRTLLQEVRRGHLHMVLIEQRKGRRMIPKLQGATFDTRGREFGCRSMHCFDGFAWRVVWRSFSNRQGLIGRAI